MAAAQFDHNDLKRWHGNLKVKYEPNQESIEPKWRSYDESQRIRAVETCFAKGRMLKTIGDTSLGKPSKLLPEWNIQDLAKSGPKPLLDILRYRAMNCLHEQYVAGSNGSLGDAEVIRNRVHANELVTNPYEEGLMMFHPQGKYGEVFAVPAVLPAEQKSTIDQAKEIGYLVPTALGLLIMERQVSAIQILSILIDVIMDDGSTAQTSKKRSKSKKSTTAAFSTLSLGANPAQDEKLSEIELLAITLDRKADLEDTLELCLSEPEVFTYLARMWHNSRPILVPDEVGRVVMSTEDKLIGASVLEMVVNLLQGAAYWSYMCKVLQLYVDNAKDSGYRKTLRQELANTAHFEYSRTQRHLKRHVQVGMGNKRFERKLTAMEFGLPKVSMNRAPDDVLRDNAQLSYLLRLCQVEIGSLKAIHWIKQVETLHETYPSEHKAMLEPTRTNPQKGQVFEKDFQNLAIELDGHKSKLNLLQYTSPISKLLQPGVTEAALKALDLFVVDKSGAKLGHLYEDLVEDSIASIVHFYQQQKSKLQQAAKDFVPIPTADPRSPKSVVQQRREKEKSRPAHSSAFDIARPPTPPTTPAAPRQVFNVTADTYEVFSAIFKKGKSQGTGSVDITDFVAAMTELGFRVENPHGSIFTYYPTNTLAGIVDRPVTIHRPYPENEIEGHRLLYYRQRLKRACGWDLDSFDQI
ncbi:uncharacterized protein PAC_16496 [Phialocephala subalpina]|uniref:Uncharacterized protein n=1 Tax=Phialocephala subalpina TaxID=576137 RepID=A0A1L7XNH3_9HELO|nr:uncharacterized protein PAC_16496 [Phialocephala subalpina]